MLTTTTYTISLMKTLTFQIFALLLTCIAPLEASYTDTAHTQLHITEQSEGSCNVTLTEGHVTLEWDLISDFYPSYYEVQRYQSGSKFETIATLTEAPKGSITYIDPEASGVVFYRLRYVGSQGQQYFSSTARVVVSDEPGITIDEDSNGQVLIHVPSQRQYEVIRVISGQDGTVLQAKKLTTEPTAVSLQAYPSGVYLVELTDVYGINKTVKKVVKF